MGKTEGGTRMGCAGRQDTPLAECPITRRAIRTRALDVHEIRVWRLHKSLELVLLLLELGRGVEEIDGESLEDVEDDSDQLRR